MKKMPPATIVRLVIEEEARDVGLPANAIVVRDRNDRLVSYVLGRVIQRLHGTDEYSINGIAKALGYREHTGACHHLHRALKRPPITKITHRYLRETG